MVATVMVVGDVLVHTPGNASIGNESNIKYVVGVTYVMYSILTPKEKVTAVSIVSASLFVQGNSKQLQPLSSSTTNDILYFGSKSHIQAYDAYNNADLFYAESSGCMCMLYSHI